MKNYKTQKMSFAFWLLKKKKFQSGGGFDSNPLNYVIDLRDS